MNQSGTMAVIKYQRRAHGRGFDSRQIHNFSSLKTVDSMLYYIVFLHFMWGIHSVVRNADLNDPNFLQQLTCFSVNFTLAPFMMAVASFTDSALN